MKLVIVESPTKAKTISKYLDKTYEVRASVGHIRDLPKSNKRAIDIPGGFIPHYEIVKGKEKIVQELKDLAKRAREILLTTDPDREGEAIAWHVIQALGLDKRSKGGDNSRGIKRIVIHEITETALKDALRHPRGIDENLRKAQEARRVLDRLVGYDLSGLIWRKIRYGLSAGRVQSPALRILMEREREIRAFKPEDYWVIIGQFKTAEGKIIILICDEKPNSEKEVKRITEIAQTHPWQVISVKETEAKRLPYAPFITSTLQQRASSRLGFSPSRTMSIAQKLYEEGFISYMRTDSLSINQTALGEIHREIEKIFGKAYLSPRKYVTRSKTAQEAHEAIRPTKISLKDAGKTSDEKKLYRLIWERTIASQMQEAKILRTKISANVIGSSDPENTIPDFSLIGSVIIFPGWLDADPRSRGEEVEVPKLNEGESLKLIDLTSEKKETLPPPRYTEAGLIKELEKRGIGRPSTYAAIIKTLFERGYVEKTERVLHPTDTGEVVNSFLEQNFKQYISDSFTALMEDELDEIAEGKKEYLMTLKNFYGPFSKEVKIKEKLKKATDLGEADKKFKCPICKSGMIIKLGRNGKFLSCKKFPECTGMRKLDGTELKGPRETGELCPRCEGKLIEREGRYGKFIACSNYPKCKYIKRTDEEEDQRRTGVGCPKCSSGEMVERRGRYGLFYSCSNYPNCKHIIKSRPTDKTCTYRRADGSICGALMMEGTKTIPERCSDKNCPNHRPDRRP